MFSIALGQFFLLIVGCYGEDYFTRWYHDETREVFGDESATLSVKGQLPSYLDGDLIRLGPTLAHTEKRNCTSFIDSYGRITKWSFTASENMVNYKSAFIRSEYYNASDELTNIPAHITIQPTEPKSRGAPNLDVMDNTNVYLHKFEGSGEYLTFTDFHLGNRVHEESLHTLGNTKFNDDLKGTFSGSHYGEYFDKATGENVIVNWLGKPKFGGIHLTMYKMGSDLVRRPVGSVDIKFTPYSIHTVVVSGDYAFVVVSPVEIDFLKSGATMCLSCSAHDKLDSGETIVYAFCLDESIADQTVKRIVSPVPFFSFHHINAVTDGSNTLLDLCVYTSMDGVLGEHVLGNFKDILDPTTRNSMASFCTNVWRLDVNILEEKISSIVEIPMVDAANNSYHGDLMIINPEHIGKPYCFFYALTTHMNDSDLYEDIGVLKVDACGHKGVLSSFYQPGIYPGEPIFVPDPNGKEEDDGVLLVLTRDGKADVSRLLVLDAKDLSHVIAEIAAPFKHMFEFHGKYFPKVGK